VPNYGRYTNMSNHTQLLADYQSALEAGDRAEALRLANVIDWEAVTPALPTKAIDTTAADNATKLRGFDYENAILARQEHLQHNL
jgi:hypothetical protein